MKIDLLRSFLYPIGFVANFLFGARFFLQWLKSEKKRKSHVTKSFWHLSLAANCIMSFHALLQLQFPIALIQSFNAIISWRNLNLMKQNSVPFRSVLLKMLLTFSLVCFLFLIQAILFDEMKWMRSPDFFNPSRKADPLSLTWHLIGLLAMILFASRFWIQWLLAEKQKESSLGRPFWLLSLTGGSISLLYFLRLGDLVNIIGHGIGILPYVRNLMLLKKSRTAE